MIPRQPRVDAPFFPATRSDELVNAQMWKTYRWMSVGVALTGSVAWLVATTPSAVQLVYETPGLLFFLIVAELVVVFAFSSVVHRVSFGSAAAMFLGYSALNGVTFSYVFLVYTQASVAQVFFVAAGAFAGLSAMGYFTKRDLSAMGRFMYMGLIGLIIASLVNLFLQNPAIYWLTTYAGVLIFAGLTAYDTQKLKNIFASQGEAGNMPLRGALILYLDFINLVWFLLRVLGQRR